MKKCNLLNPIEIDFSHAMENFNTFTGNRVQFLNMIETLIPPPSV